MHELTIAEGILEIVLAAAIENEAEHIVRIKIQAGQLTMLEPNALMAAFAAISAGTCAREALIDIEICPLCAGCQDCGHQFNVKNYCFICPACGSGNSIIISGRELKVIAVEVE